MIEKCGFGKMTIDSRTYDSDLWILPDQRVRDSWWRRDGHRLHMEDISGLLETTPEVLVVGTGIYGRMRIDADIEPHLRDLHIEVKTARTEAAAKIFNELLTEGRKVAACFHLTC